MKLIHELINDLQIDTFDLAGSSMGGTIAALYIQHHPQQVRSLAFIGSPLGVIDWTRSVREAIYQGINPFIPITTEQFDLEITLLFVNPPKIPSSVKAEKVKDYIAHNRHYQQVWDIVNLYDDALCQSPPIQAPTLIIWGEDDKIFAVSGASKLQRCIPNSKTLILPKAGHLLLIENAADAVRNTLTFCKPTRKYLIPATQSRRFQTNMRSSSSNIYKPFLKIPKSRK